MVQLNCKSFTWIYEKIEDKYMIILVLPGARLKVPYCAPQCPHYLLTNQDFHIRRANVKVDMLKDHIKIFI